MQASFAGFQTVILKLWIKTFTSIAYKIGCEKIHIIQEFYC